MLGAASGVTDSNMIQYLGIIEQRTNELLAVQSYVNSKVMLNTCDNDTINLFHGYLNEYSLSILLRETMQCYGSKL